MHHPVAECTFSHFEKNSSCPSCNRTMQGENDFRELMILNPPAHDKLKESMYKRIFVKSSPDDQTLTADDLWNRIQRQHAMVREGTKFVLRQFLKENIAQTRRSSQTENALRALKDDHSSLKREINKQKEITEGYKQELVVAGQKIEEKDRQLAQFRKMFESRTPQSAGSILSGGGSSSSHGGRHMPAQPRRVSDQHFSPPSATSGTSRHSRNHHQHGRQGPRDRANPYEQQLGSGSTSRDANRPPIVNPYNKASSRPLSQPLSQQNHNRHSQHASGAVTQHPYQQPYQQPPAHIVAMTQPPPSSQPRRSHPNSHSQHHSQLSYHCGGSVASRRSTGSGSASESRIRHITATTGYSFSGVGVGSSSSNHSNGGGRAERVGGGGGGGNHARRKRRALSPSHAFAANPYRQGPSGPSLGYRQQSY